MRVIRHIIITFISLMLLVGVPVFLSGYPARVMNGVDAVSSPTVIVDAPEGEYVVLVNSDRHKDSLPVWKTFFEGGDIDFIFEDISCLSADTDPAGLETAKSFASRLPANQMSLRTEDMTLILSKALYGDFDVIILSGGCAETYKATAGLDAGRVLVITGGDAVETD